MGVKEKEICGAIKNREEYKDFPISELMLDNADTQMAYLDPDFNIVKVNKSYANGARRKVDELTGKNHFDLFPDKDNLKIFKLARDSGQSLEFHAKPFTYPNQPERGTTYWDWKIKPVKGDDGNVVGLLLSLREVSDQYRIWKQSKRSALKLMGYLTFMIFSAELLIMGVLNSLNAIPSLLSIIVDPVVLCLIVLPILYYFFLHPLVTNLTRTENSQSTLLKSFEHLEYERKRLFSILDELPASIHLVTSNHKIIYANRYFKERFGDDFKSPCYKILHGQEKPCPICNVKEVFRNSKGGEFEELHANNHLYKLYNYPFTDIDGTPLVLQLGIDITEQKEYEKQLIQTEKLLTVAEMTALISHEFRNSLTSVKMILELQCESERLNKSEKNSLEVVLSSIRHMEDVVTQLLNFSQPNPMNFKDENINTIIEESLEFTMLHLRKHDISVEKNLNLLLPEFRIDRSHLKEALINLILNAAHAISMNPTTNIRRKIEIRTEKIRLDKMLREKRTNGVLEKNKSAIETGQSHEVVLRRGEFVIMLTISDNGIGIDQDKIDKVFNPFYTNNKIGGTGLGLTMVKRTINAHQGIISVESMPGDGSIFTIYLPIETV